MNKKNAKRRKYPDQMTIDKIKFKKSPDEFYMELQPELHKLEVDKFLDQYKELIEWRFKPTDIRTLTLHKFNRSIVRCKWVSRAKGRKETVNQLIGEFAKDQRVQVAGPVYLREDLKYPNGFTFKDQIIIRFDETVRNKGLQSLFRELGVEKVKGPRGDLGDGMMLLRVRDNRKQNTHEVAQKLAKSKLIKSAHVNLIQLHQI